MSPQLHPVTGKNSFCGPTAMATVLGISTDHAARIIRGVSGDRSIKGVSERHLWEALTSVGCSLTFRNFRDDGTGLVSAGQWVQRNADLFATRHAIIVFGRHYGTLLGERYQCSLTHRAVSLDELPHPHEVVEACLFVDALPQQAPVDTVAHEIRRNAQTMAKAKSLAHRHGIVIETVDGGGWYEVFCPDLQDDDPHEGWASPETGQEVLALVKDYVDYLQNGYLEAVTAPCLMYPRPSSNACALVACGC
ncbi:MAG: hypothetical protein Q8S02_11770 [Hydrogenophaga sp.]|nr:hypothetical protein [Hydrogenophaga sp.]